MEDVKAKEAVLLKTRLLACEHATKLHVASIASVSRRDLALHTKAMQDMSPPLQAPLALQLALAERRVKDILADIMKDSLPAADRKTQIAFLLTTYCPWDGSDAEKFSFCEPAYHASVCQMTDDHNFMMMDDETSDDQKEEKCCADRQASVAQVSCELMTALQAEIDQPEAIAVTWLVVL
jgi:hypothetical protein